MSAGAGESASSPIVPVSPQMIRDAAMALGAAFGGGALGELVALGTIRDGLLDVVVELTSNLREAWELRHRLHDDEHRVELCPICRHLSGDHVETIYLPRKFGAPS